MVRRLLVLTIVLAALAAACGDDGSGGEPGSNDDGGDDEFIVPETSAEDSVLTQLLGIVFGLPGDFVSDEENACMSAELEPLFPDGVVPEDVGLSEDLVDAVDTAAETCGVAALG